MKITINVKPNAKKERVEKTGERQYAVWIAAAPVEGRANKASIEAMSRYLDIPKSRIILLKGHKARTKILEIT